VSSICNSVEIDRHPVRRIVWNKAGLVRYKSFYWLYSDAGGAV
jgi:hypothetical protein